MQANAGQHIPTKVHSNQCRPKNSDRDRPKWCNTSFRPRYVFIPLFIHLPLIYTSVHCANAGQQQLTTANAGQHIPMKAHSSQHRPMNGDTEGPEWCNTSFGPSMFLFFLFIYLLLIYYISVHRANAGQSRPTKASTGWQPPTVIIFTYHHLIQLYHHPIQPITPSLCSTTTTLFNHTTSSFNHKLQSFSSDIVSIILSLSSN